MENETPKTTPKKERFMIYFTESQYDLFQALQIETNLGPQGTIHHALKMLSDKSNGPTAPTTGNKPTPAYILESRAKREAAEARRAEKERIKNMTPGEQALARCTKEGGTIGLWESIPSCLILSPSGATTSWPLPYQLAGEVLAKLQAEAEAKKQSNTTLYICASCTYTERKDNDIVKLRGAPFCVKHDEQMIPGK